MPLNQAANTALQGTLRDKAAHTTRVFRSIKEGTPVLYVAPKRDYPGLQKSKHQNFEVLPSHAQTRLYEPDSDHLNAPTAAASEVISWIRQISGQ